MKILLFLLFFLFLASSGLVFPLDCEERTINPRPGPRNTPLDRFLRDIGGDTDGECYNVTINEGSYVLRQGITISGGGGVTLIANGNVLIRFSSPNATELTAVEFINLYYVEMFGITLNGSSGFLSFTNVSNIGIHNSRFRLFQRGTLVVQNCNNVLISNSVFRANGENVATRNMLEGGSGGLSLQYTDEVTFPQPPTFLINDCSFIANEALVGDNAAGSFSEVDRDESVYTGRGGAIFILMQNTQRVIGIIRNSVFNNNKASFYGGAIYIAFNSLSRNNITIHNSIFRRNSAGRAGGGIMMSFQEGGDDEHINSVNMHNCIMRNNTAPYGGGVYFLISIQSGREDGELGCFALFLNCTYINNYATEYGAAIGATALNLFESKAETRPAAIVDCTFRNNEGGTSVIAITNFPFVLRGNNTIRNSEGSAIMIIQAKVFFNGTINIIDTNAQDNGFGSLVTLSHGQIQLMKNTKVSFIRNRGGLGAALHPILYSAPNAYPKLLLNPLCTLLYEIPHLPPDRWQVNMTFDHNRADIGSAVYTNRLNLCSWTSYDDNNMFDIDQAYHWNFIHFGPSNFDKAHPFSESGGENVVQTQPASVSTMPVVEGLPGQEITLQISSFSETNDLTFAFWRFIAEGGEIVFSPSVRSAPFDLTRSTDLIFYVNESLTERPLRVNVRVTTLLNEDEKSTYFQVIVKDCPVGTLLKAAAITGYSRCVCNQGRKEIVFCDRSRIYMIEENWATQSEDESDSLFLYACPPGHCQCTVYPEPDYLACYYEYEKDAPDDLCSCDRTGVLCGECKNGAGVSVLLNKCVTCSDAYSIFIVILIVFDIVVFVIILNYDRCVPPWYISTLFYLQLLPLLTQHFPVTFDRVHPYLYYVASFLSFYFPYDFCLYSNMNSLVSYTLKFLPFTIAVIVVPLTKFVRNYIFRRVLKPSPFHGIYEIFTSLFIPTVYAAMSILNCPSIPISDANSTHYELRWFHNGSVTCFSDGGHIALTFFSLIVLLVAIVSIVLNIVISSNKFERYRWVSLAAISMTSSYKEKFWFWSSVEVIKRLLIVTIIIATPLNTTAQMGILIIIVGVQAIIQPYKSQIGNIIDLVVGTMVILLLLNVITPRILELVDSLDIVGDNSSFEYLTTVNRCDVELKITPCAIYLAFWYYLPLTVMVGAVACYVIRKIYFYSKRKHEEKKKVRKLQHELNLSRVTSVRHEVHKDRERTGMTMVERFMSEIVISPTRLKAAEEIEWKLTTIKEQDVENGSIKEDTTTL